MAKQNLYQQRGVSAQKEDVHRAIQNLDQGLYPHAFCKVYPDVLAGDDQWVNIMHADGAGTKSILAYLYWKETGDISVWKGIAQDAVVMNLDDLLCVGVYNNIIFNSTIDRNKNLIPGEVLQQIIDGTQAIFDQLKTFGVNISYLGGETADVGDVVRTIAVNGTMACRWPKDKIITNQKIQHGDVIVGLASFGKAHYETHYNSGIGSNGLTSARHDTLHKFYAQQYKESYNTSLPDDVVYIGGHKLTDSLAPGNELVNIGRMLLSPTRTYAPVIKKILENHFHLVHGLIHCSGGGQTKCMKYLPATFKVIKDNLFMPPPVFDIIRQNSGATLQEMYEVFNMGCRLEIFCKPADAKIMMDIAEEFGIQAQITGRVEAAERNQLIIKTAEGDLLY
ncbi:MAG: phosphoribosylformylglycinamidine cyclo-ligase [Niastella sp. SCN 39-18]|nr:phosphoribosylformylglycinamidine cyclo-ligase [Sphingobacteriales bacterium]ODT53422.1 MAG: phosphoribosylformylglycinamidine cyclo-ligase [Niastella sp. SCN 39-18]OJW07723.1 MAG: phosphoribosylformylglycinamidine cyclo-ligase [Sphingobacteriales bacterium 39-19]